MPATRGSTAHSAGNLRNSCSTAELCRRRSRIADARIHQLFPLMRHTRDRASRPSTALEQLMTVGTRSRVPDGDQNGRSILTARRRPIHAFADLEPGSYVALCSVPQGTKGHGPGDGAPNFTLGMKQEFTVKYWSCDSARRGTASDRRGRRCPDTTALRPGRCRWTANSSSYAEKP
jgi:hypothetical protein